MDNKSLSTHFTRKKSIGKPLTFKNSNCHVVRPSSFDLILDPPATTPTFESRFGRLLARNALKVGVLAGRSMKKSKTSSDSSSGLGILWRSGSSVAT